MEPGRIRCAVRQVEQISTGTCLVGGQTSHHSCLQKRLWFLNVWDKSVRGDCVCVPRVALGLGQKRLCWNLELILQISPLFQAAGEEEEGEAVVVVAASAETSPTSPPGSNTPCSSSTSSSGSLAPSSSPSGSTPYWTSGSRERDSSE